MLPETPAKVLLADESPLFCRLLGKLFESVADVRIVATAHDASAVRSLVLETHPDVLLMSLPVASLDEFHLLRRLRELYPVPVFAYGAADADASDAGVRALEFGVLEVLTRPRNTPQDLAAFVEQVTQKIVVATAKARPARPSMATGDKQATSFRAAGIEPGKHIVVVGGGAGGLDAVRAMLAHAPSDFPPTVVMLQMPSQLLGGLAERLNEQLPLHVAEARGGDLLTAGKVIIARGERQIVMQRAADRWRARYISTPMGQRAAPTIDALFSSAASAAGSDGVGIVLSGMGDDGATGLAKMREVGAVTFVQNARSSVLHGMAAAAVEIGAAEHQEAPESIPERLLQALRSRQTVAGGQMA